MTPVRFLMLTFGLYFGLVIVFGSGSQPNYDPVPTKRQPNQTVVISTLSPQEQLDQIQALEALRQAELAEYDTYPYYEEDIVQATYAPNIFSSYKCGQWLPTAVLAGWPDDRQVLERLGAIVWRESRCQPTACAPSDSDRTSENGEVCRDYGLMQGNWSAHHKWWAELGITPEDMFDPYTNLHWAWLLYSGREAQGKCGWQPWSISC